MDDELLEELEENLTGPKEMTADGITRVQHPLPDQIEAIKFLTPASSKPARGMRITRLISPGTA